MAEIIKLFLENEMDLILAQQRSMKLAEFTGLSLSAQTSFGTAVSEVCRYVLNKSMPVTLTLGVNESKDSPALTAKITHNKNNVSAQDEALLFASRLVNRVVFTNNRNASYNIELYESLSSRQKLTIQLFDEWRHYFRNQAPLSPYEEVKLKNIQLRELTQKLAQSEQQYKTLAESLPLVIFTTSPGGELQYVNNWFKEFTGQELDDIKQSNWGSLVHDEDIEALRAPLVNDDGPARHDEYRIKNKNGEYVWHTGKTVPVNDEENTELYRIGYFADINAQKLVEQTLKDNKELKEAQQELARYQVELEQHITELNQSNFELAQFAYVSSHDLQEPLRKLMIYNDTLQHKFAQNVPPEVKYIMDRMTDCCKRMRSLITDLLSFSKIRKDELVFSEVDLNDVVAHALENLDLVTKEKKAVITVEPLPKIEASSRHVMQLFENLISNSLKYSKPDVTPAIDIQVVNTTGSNVVLQVADNGIGFENQYAERIFGLFQRLYSKSEYEGTGIGLALCRKITDLHNGSIIARGEIGRGAFFTITLPVKQVK